MKKIFNGLQRINAKLRKLIGSVVHGVSSALRKTMAIFKSVIDLSLIHISFKILFLNTGTLQKILR